MRIFLFKTLALTGLVLLPIEGRAAECGPLKLINQVQLQTGAEGRRELIPVSINGTEKIFVFDTGAPITSVSRNAANELRLPTRQGDFTLYDVAGRVSRDQAAVKVFAFGRANIRDTFLPVLDNPGLANGVFGVDFLASYDADVDFGSDVLRIFSKDHCEGGVLYWQAPATGIVPIRTLNGKITVSVAMDGHKVNAIIDTGAPETIMSQDIARNDFGLTLGGPGVEEAGELGGVPGSKVYAHTFGTLSFGDIEVKNPRVKLLPDVMGRNGERQQTAGDRARLYKDEIKLPEVIIGMNVLRKLHVYMAFGEGRLYVSPASAGGATASPPAASAK